MIRPSEKRPLRILIDARMIRDHVHGIGRYAANLIQGLASRGHQISILSDSKNTVDILGPKNVTEVVMTDAPFARPNEAWRLIPKVLSLRYDLVHFPSFSVPALLPRNAVVTIHDLIHLYPPVDRKHWIYYQTVVRAALFQAREIITVSEWTKRDLRRMLQVSESKINVVRNGLEKIWFEKNDVALPSPLKEPFFLCVSNTKPHKNVKTLIRACRRLWRTGQQFSLALSLGGAPLPDNFFMTPSEAGRIFLLRDVPESEFKNYFVNALAIISTSHYEGSDLPCAEALAVGQNVLASRGSAHEELQGERLKIYGASDDDERLAEEMKKILVESNNGQNNGRPNQAQHNIITRDEMIEQTLGVYDKALSGFSLTGFLRH